MRGHRTLRAGVALIALAVLFANRAAAQIQLGNLLPNPRLSTLMPCGAKVGTTVTVTFTGSDLDEPQSLLFSHPGIKGEAIIPPLPPAPKPDPKKPAPKPTPPPPPPPVTQFKVTVGKDVPPGFYDVRFVNHWGVSNPRTFVIGTLDEVVEKEPNNDIEQAQRVEIGTTITGTISAPTDVDYTVFKGKKGQRVLVYCLASSIDSRMNPELRLFDANDRQLAYSRPSPGNDGLLDATLPADGDYYVRLCQFTYTLANAEYFYRLTISTGPWIDLVFPPMVEPGKMSQLTVYGRNLPGGKPDAAAAIDGHILEKITVNVTAPNDPMALQRLGYSGHVSPMTGTLDGFEYRVNTPAGVSNPFLITFARAPVVVEKDANDTPESAQEVPLPVEVAGKIDKRGDRDWYAFTAKKGDVYTIEVFSHRLGAPTDIYVSLRNLATKQEITQLDDTPQPLSLKNFYTVHRDPQAYRFVAPADGKYHILVASHVADTLADPQHFYRLRITPEHPDFRLVVMPPDDYRPDACTVGQGSSRNFIVLIERHDGFKGEVALSVEGLPAGVTCPPQVLGPNMKETLLVVSASAMAPVWTGEIKIKGTAVINGAKVIREARPASITWPTAPQQNIPAIARLDRNLVLAVRDKAPFNLVAQADKTTITHGGKVNVKLTLERHWAAEMKAPLQIQLVPTELPPGMKFANVTIAPDKKEATLVLDVPANVVPGTYSVVFRSFTTVQFAQGSATMKKGRKKGPQGQVNVVLPSTPITFNVLPKEVAKLTVPAILNTKIGNQVEVPVTVTRLYDYNDAFTVQLVLPAGVQGLNADEVTIPAGQTSAKLIVRVPANAAPGNRANVIVRATAVLQGNTVLTHETKFNINVTK